ATSNCRILARSSIAAESSRAVLTFQSRRSGSERMGRGRRLMVVMAFIFVLGLGGVVIALIQMSKGNDPGEEGDDDGPPRRGRGPWRPRPSGSDPSWWPEFEREFRAYARTHKPRPKVTGVS